MRTFKRGDVVLATSVFLYASFGMVLATPAYINAQSADLQPIEVCQFPQNRALLSYAVEDAVYPNFSASPIQVNIPAGVYTITADSFEDHIGSNDPTQSIEQWQIMLYGDSGHVYSSNFTDDIPDDINTNTTEIGHEVSLPQISGIRFAHIAYTTGLEDAQFGGQTFDSLTQEQKNQVKWNSVIPSCIKFDPVVNTSNPDIICTALGVQKLEDTSYEVTVELSEPLNDVFANTIFSLRDSSGNLISEQTVSGLSTNFMLEPGEYIVTATISGEVIETSCQTDIQVAEDGGSVLGTTDDNSVDGQASLDDNGHVLAATGNPASLLLGAGSLIVLIALLGSQLTHKRSDNTK